MADPSISPRGRGGEIIATVSSHQRALRQKRDTADGLESLGLGIVESIAVLTSLGSEGSMRRTVVDYVDPKPPAEVVELLRQRTSVVRELIADAHFGWVADLFDVDIELWGSSEGAIRQLRTEGRLQRDIVVPADGGDLRFRLELAEDLSSILQARSIEALDRYSIQNPEAPDGLRVSVIEAPAQLTDQTRETSGEPDRRE